MELLSSREVKILMEENDWNPPESGRSTRQSPRTLHWRVPGLVDRRGQW